MQVVVQDLITNYQRQGEGKTILLLHGWGDRLETFSTITPELVKKYEILALDLPGFGQTQASNGVWKLDDYGAFVAAFLDKLGVKTTYAIIGHSNGGALAIRALSLKQLQATKLVLLSSSGVRDTDNLKRVALKAIAKTGKVALFWLPKSAKQRLQKKLYGTIGSDMLVAPHLQETFKQTIRQDIQQDAMNIITPTLLIYGDNDTATPAQTVGKKLNLRISGSKIKIIHGADHFVHQTAPDEVAKDILEFLK